MPSSSVILAIVGIAFFCAASVCALVGLLRTHPFKRGDLAVSWLLSLGCVSLLVLLVLQEVIARRLPFFNRFDALTLYALLLTVAALCLLTRHRTQGVMAILAPYVALLLIASFPDVGVKVDPVPHQVPNVVLLLHLGIAFAGYSLFSLAGILACAYLVQDHNLKHRHFGLVFERFPALETLDHLMSRLVGIAFLLLTISLVLGFYLVYLSGTGSEWITDPKVMATMVTWSLCAMLVHMRANAGRHGTRVAILTVVGLVLVLFSMVGVHMIARSVHDFVLSGGNPN